MSTVAHFFIIIVAQKFVITWLTFSLTFTRRQHFLGFLLTPVFQEIWLLLLKD